MTNRAVKVGPKGQVVIPKVIRDQLGIKPGERVMVDRDGSEVRIRRALALEELYGIFADTPGGTKDLEREHREEVEREERKIRRHLS